MQRISAGGIIDCPKPKETAIQYIDARDQARFVLDLIEQGTTGVFNSCVSPEITFSGLLETVLATVGPPGTILNWVDVVAEDEEDRQKKQQCFPCGRVLQDWAILCP